MNIFFGKTISPKVADLAFTSISIDGIPGFLNNYVLTELSYSTDEHPKDLGNGFRILQKNGRKPIAFIVSIDNKRSTRSLIETNLYSALTVIDRQEKLNSIWIPLMGTGAGNLSFRISFEIIVETIRRISSFKTIKDIYISFPSEMNQSEISKLQDNAVSLSKIANIEMYDEKKVFNINTDKNKAQKIIEKSTLQDSYYSVVYSLLNNIFNGTDKNYYWLNLDFSKYKKEVSLTGFALNYPIPSDQIEIFNQLKKGDFVIGYDRELDVIKCLFVYIENDNDILPKFSIFKVLYEFEKNLSWENLLIDEKSGKHTPRLGIYNSKLNLINESLLIQVITQCTEDFDNLLKHLNTKTLHSYSKNKVLNPLPTLSNQSFITPILKDTPHGTDYLDIKYDVAAFSKVLCMKELPTPLSIALFGEWGSGKSFFMRCLKDEIEKHAAEKNPFYCNNIIHIEFNAWSYLDANLWASLASIIFEEIYKKLKGNNDIDDAVNSEIKSTTDKISFVEIEIDQINLKIDSFKLEINEIIRLKNENEKQLSDLKTKLSENSEQTIVKTILQELNIKETIDEAFDNPQLKAFVDLNVETKTQVENLLKEVNKLPFTFKAIFSKSTYFYLSIISIVIIIFIALGFKYDLSYLNQKILILPQILLGIISFASPILLRINKLIKQVQPVLKKVNDLNDKVQIKYTEKISQAQLEIEHLNAKIRTIRSEIEFQNQEQLRLENEKRNLEKRLKSDLFSEAFKTRINHIIDTNKYHDHLGLVSQLRKDFELLSNLFIKQNTGISNSINDEIEQPIQRIILYIDDLDRCSEDIVIAVLEAVNLLLAFPLFVVVVGVDHRWVKNALINKHYKQFGIKENVPEYERIEPSSYLEKIFQIPFHLKKASSKSVRNMIEELIKSDLSNESIDLPVETEKPKRGRKRKDQPDQKPSESTEIKEPIMGGTTEFDSAVLIEATEKKALNSTEELLQLTDYEKRLLPEFEFILGSNPRTIKRFVNIYRIVRAHAELPGGQNKDEENLICMFLVALAVGEHKSIFQKLNKYLEKNFSAEPFHILLKQNIESENKLLFLLSDNDALKKLLELNFNRYRDIYSFVSRFSFRYEIIETKKETEKN